MQFPIIKIDTKGNVTQLDLDLRNVLEQAYREIECDTVDITPININGIEVDVLVDGEGLLKDNPILTVYINRERYFVGNVLLVPGDVDGNGDYYRGFTEEELTTIQNNIRELVDFSTGLKRKVLVVSRWDR